MRREKTVSIGKRIMAAAIVVITLLSIFPISASAATSCESVFAEALLNTQTYSYAANLIPDEGSKSKKYAYKYMNLGYITGNGKSPYEDSPLNPNAVFQLQKQWGLSENNLDRFMLLEGYRKDFFENNPYVDGSLITEDNNRASASKFSLDQVELKTKNARTNPLSFPGYYTAKVTSEQSEYAQEVLNALVGSVNGILTTVNNGIKFKSVVDLVNKSILIRPDDDNNITILQRNESGGYTGYYIVYADLTNISDEALIKEKNSGQVKAQLKNLSTDNKSGYAIAAGSSSELLNAMKLPRANSDGALYCYIFPIIKDNMVDVSDVSVYPYAYPRGYKAIEYAPGRIFSYAKFTDAGNEYKYVSEKGEDSWISIHMLTMYANTVYKYRGVSVSTYSEEQSVIGSLIQKLMDSLLTGIRNVLNLSSIEQLVFNLGARGGSLYNYGLMSDSWWHVTLQYQLIFQIIAWIILVIGFIKTLIDLNLSTINPQKRLTLYNTIEKFIVVGLGMVIIVPVVQFMLEANDTVVELFSTQITTSSLNMPTTSNALVQFILGIMWIAVTLYINFIYIMRSITVALLIASAPFFISTIAFSDGGRQSLFVSWLKELVANIFVQSVHAFVLSFLIQLLGSGSFLETFAISISIIPLTEMFRSLIFAGAGDATSKMASNGAGFVKNTAKGVVKGIANGIGDTAAGVSSLIDGNTPGGTDGSPSGGGSGGGGKGGGVKADPGVAAFSDLTQRKAMQRFENAGRLAEEGYKGKAAGQVALGLGGLAAGASLSGSMSMLDVASSFGDFALSGDYRGVGNSVETATSTAISGPTRAVAGGIVATTLGVKDAKEVMSEESVAQAGLPKQARALKLALAKKFENAEENNSAQSSEEDKAKRIDEAIEKELEIPDSAPSSSDGKSVRKQMPASQLVEAIKADRDNRAKTAKKSDSNEPPTFSHDDYVDDALLTVFEHGGCQEINQETKRITGDMSLSEAHNILKAQGISNPRVVNDTFEFDGVRSPSSSDAWLTDVRHVVGKSIATYNIGANCKNGPVWKADGNGGGQMSFANKNDAMSFFERGGRLDVAKKIEGLKVNSDAVLNNFASLQYDRDQFLVTFDGIGMREQGKQLEVNANGIMFASAARSATPFDPFAPTIQAWESGDLTDFSQDKTSSVNESNGTEVKPSLENEGSDADLISTAHHFGYIPKEQ